MDAFAAGLTVVMFVGAANADATAAQREELRDVLSYLRDEELTASEAYREVILHTADVMGPEWYPQGEWAEWIENLMRDR